MAVGTYNLPICDGCKLPWLPVGWTQDSNPRNLREGAKPLRCGKCKSIGWDREFVKQQKAEATEMAVNPFDPTKTIEMPRNLALNAALDKGTIPPPTDTSWEMGGVDPAIITSTPRPARCAHRMTDCPICHPKEAA